MKEKLRKKISIISSVAFLVGALYMPAAAEEINIYEGNMSEAYGIDAANEEYNYIDAPTRVSFGQVVSGESTGWQDISFTNYGIEPHYYTVAVSDPSKWYVDIPDINPILNGQTLSISVMPRTGEGVFSQGDYTGTITIYGYDTLTSDITSTTVINLYVSVINRPNPYISRVDIYPSLMSMATDSYYTFTANVEAGGGASTEVNWNIKGQNSIYTSISQNGELYLGADETATDVYVIATSKQDPNYVATVDVSVVRNSFTVNTQVYPASSGTVTGQGEYRSGDPATLIASSANGYVFTGWRDESNNLVSTDSRYVFNVSRSITLTATFDPCSIRVNTKKNIDQAGTITPSATVMMGGSYTITAAPNAGYSFEGWYEGNNLVTNQPTLTVNGITYSREFTAVFSQSKYNVVIATSPQNGGSVTGGGNYNRGSDVTLTATAAAGYEFIGWGANNALVSTDANMIIKGIDRDYSFCAMFKQKQSRTFTVSASSDSANGSVSPFGSVVVEEGKSVVFNGMPAKDCYISDVKVDGKSVGNVTSYIFNGISADHTIQFCFEKLKKEEPVKPAGNNQNNSSTTNNSSDKGNSAANNSSSSTTSTSQGNGNVQVEVNTASTEESREVIALTGTLQDLNITEAEARAYIEAGNDRFLMENALLRGDFEVTVRNKYSDVPNETAVMSYYDIASVPNIEDVLDATLSADNKINLFAGEKVRTNLSIVGIDDVVEDSDVQIIKNKLGNEISASSFFDVRFIMEIGGAPELIRNSACPIQIVMKVTPEMKASGGEYLVARLHDGVVDILPDEDNSPDTITFSTDKMSVFALAYYNNSAQVSDVSSTTEQPVVTSPVTNTVQKKDNTKAVVATLIGVILLGTAAITGVVMTGRKHRRKHRK